MPWIRTMGGESVAMRPPGFDGDPSPSPELSHRPHGQRQPNVRAAAGPVRRLGATAVRGGDRLDDRKPEPAPVAVSWVCAAEPLEGPREEVFGKAAASVEHVELDRAVVGVR